MANPQVATKLFGPLLLTTTAATMYYCPPSSQAVLEYLVVSNPSGSPATFTLSIGADAAATRLYSGVTVAAGDSQRLRVGYALSAGEKIQMLSNTDGVLLVSGNGYENTSIDYYKIDFDIPESVISYGGYWLHNSTVYWTKIQTSGGLAYGTQPTGGFDDSYAYVGGLWSPDQSAKGTVHKNPAIDTSTNHEVEVFLRMADTASTARGYEINYAYDGQYATLVRWNGPHSGGEGVQWTTLIDAHGLPAMVTGDTLSAQIVGSTITAFRNGVQILQFTDSTWSDGAPGMAFFHGLTADASPMSYYSFSSFEAQSL